MFGSLLHIIQYATLEMQAIFCTTTSKTEEVVEKFIDYKSSPFFHAM
jgi:hypothetical protein